MLFLQAEEKGTTKWRVGGEGGGGDPNDVGTHTYREKWGES